jgi:hypothetical protein
MFAPLAGLPFNSASLTQRQDELGTAIERGFTPTDDT